MRIIKYYFNWDGKREYCKRLHLTEHLSIGKGLYSGLIFRIDGLGLTEAERVLFATKFLKPNRSSVNAYIGKLIISYHKVDIPRQYSHVFVYEDKSLKRCIYELFYNYKKKYFSIRKSV